MSERPKHSLSEDIHDAARYEGIKPKNVTDWLVEVTERMVGINGQIKRSDTNELGKLEDALKKDDEQTNKEV